MQSTSSSTRTFQSSSASQDKSKPAAKSPRIRPAIRRKQLTWLLIAGLLLLCTFLFVQYREARQRLNGGPQQTAALIARAGRVAVLPNETPTIYTIRNADKLRSQAFFANVKDGDKVLVYSGAKKAILFRPDTDQIVNIVPINAATDTTSQTH